jgi:hypothetical protein
MRCGIGHAPPTAGGAEASALAGERDEAVAATGVAVEAKEAVGEDPAGKVATQLPLDEAGHRMIALAGACEKRLEVLADALV